MSDLNGGPAPRDDGPALGADLIIPVLAAAFTIYFLASSASLVWEARANGTVIGVALLAMVAVQFVRVGLRLREGRGTLSFGELGRMTPEQARRLGLIGVSALFIATIPWLGTTLGLLLGMTASMWVLGVRDPRTLIGVSVATAATVYLLFIALLQSRLPTGPIEKLLAPLFGGGA